MTHLDLLTRPGLRAMMLLALSVANGASVRDSARGLGVDADHAEWLMRQPLMDFVLFALSFFGPKTRVKICNDLCAAVEFILFGEELPAEAEAEAVTATGFNSTSTLARRHVAAGGKASTGGKVARNRAAGSIGKNNDAGALASVLHLFHLAHPPPFVEKTA